MVAYYYPERLSEKVESELVQISEPLISWLTEVEFASSLAKKVRAKQLDVVSAQEILKTFQGHIKQTYFKRVEIGANHFLRAKNWIETFQTSLRTLDALHLAAADFEEAQMLTADALLAESASTLQISVRLVN